MKKIIVLSILIVIKSTSLFSQDKNVFTATKQLKLRKDAKAFNAKIPSAKEWVADVEKLIAANDCEGLNKIVWLYSYMTVNDDNTISYDSINPACFKEAGGDNELFYSTWHKVGVELGKCKRLDILFGKFGIKKGETEFHPQIIPGQSRHYEMIEEVKKNWSSENKSFNEALIDLINKQNTYNEKADYAYNIFEYLYYKYNYAKDTEIDVKLVETMSIVYKRLEYSWQNLPRLLEYWSDINYQEAVPNIIESLSAGDNRIRYNAVKALRKMKVKSAISKLEYLAKNDPFYYIDDYGVIVYETRDAAKEAIEYIKSE